jgi:hypothetical protein
VRRRIGSVLLRRFVCAVSSAVSRKAGQSKRRVRGDDGSLIVFEVGFQIIGCSVEIIGDYMVPANAGGYRPAL